MYRQFVNEYISNKSIDPLQFKHFSSNSDLTKVVVKYHEELSLDELVLKCLELTNFNWSFSEDNGIETCSRKWRSVLDIWRHVKYYRPEVTIFEVMNSLYRNKKELIGQYCDQVHRRVFKLKKFNNNLTLNSQDNFDEFGLKFKDWESI